MTGPDNNIPWFFFEVKVKDRPFAAHHYVHSRALGNIPVVQLTRENNIQKKAKAYSIAFQPAGSLLSLRRAAPLRELVKGALSVSENERCGLPPAAKNLFEKRFLDLQKLLVSLHY